MIFFIVCKLKHVSRFPISRWQTTFDRYNQMIIFLNVKFKLEKRVCKF